VSDQSSAVDKVRDFASFGIIKAKAVGGDPSLKQERDEPSHLDDVILAGVRLRTIQPTDRAMQLELQDQIEGGIWMYMP